MEYINIKDKIVYCHFSFKHVKGTDDGYFSAALFWDYKGKYMITHTTQRLALWKNTSLVPSIQAYSFALGIIHRYQGDMLEHGVKQVMLVTDNRTLANWIIEPEKNKNYTVYMDKAVEKYMAGGANELVIGVGLCEPLQNVKSYKYCNEEFVENRIENTVTIKHDKQSNTNKISLSNVKAMSVLDIIKNDITEPEIKGIELCDTKEE